MLGHTCTVSSPYLSPTCYHLFPGSPHLKTSEASLVLVKNLPEMRETWVQSLGWEDALEKGKATHSSILAWWIPWTIQSMESQRVGQNWVTITLTTPQSTMHLYPINIQAPHFGEGGPEIFSHLLAWWPCEYSLSLLQTEAQGLAWGALGKPTRISNTRGQTKLYERMVVATATKLTGRMKSDANGTRSLSACVDCSRTSRTNKIQGWIIKAMVPTRGRTEKEGLTGWSKVLSHNVGAGCPRLCSLFKIPWDFHL